MYGYKKINLFFLIIVVTIICCSEPIPPRSIETAAIKSVDTTLLSIKKQYDFSSTYPFSKCSGIRIFAYPDRMSWDTIKQHGDYMNVNILRNGRLDIDSNQIKEEIVLSAQQQKELFNVLFNVQCKQEGAAACYEPRHAIVFYDKDKKAFAFIEICLGCIEVRTSPGMKMGIFCMWKAREISKLFKNFGIKYGIRKDE